MLIWINTPQSHSRKFLFLDRDGVLNVDRSDYVKHWNEFRFYPDALDALRWLHHREVNVILISNQSALHRGLITRDDFWELHDRMIRTIRQAGGELLATFYCPHRPDETCVCRKPSPEMILAASRLYAISLESAYMIGDRPTDMLAASQAGCRGILLERMPPGGSPGGSPLRTPGGTPPEAGSDSVATESYKTLFEAVTALLETGNKC